MTDLDALLAAVLDRPDDDNPRQIYADAIEEQAGGGDPQHLAARTDTGATIADHHPHRPGVTPGASPEPEIRR